MLEAEGFIWSEIKKSVESDTKTFLEVVVVEILFSLFLMLILLGMKKH